MGKRVRKKVRSVGRPSAQSEQDVRAALIAAAKQLFLQQGFDRVTAREIAAVAGTTPAMIHYYFDNKLGLFREMVRETIEPLGRMLAAGAGESQSIDIAKAIEGHIRIAAANPWIASLIVNEVLAEGGQLRETFVRDIASRLMPLLVGLLEQGRRSGRFRSDLDPALTALSIVSLNVFPFISRPVTQPLIGFGVEGADLDRLIEHTTRFVLAGISPPSTKARST